MNPRILLHKVVVVTHLNYIWEWSIHYGTLSAVFTPLHSSTNQELFEKHTYNQVATMKNMDDLLLRKGSHRVQPPN